MCAQVEECLRRPVEADERHVSLDGARRNLAPLTLLVTIALIGLGFIITHPEGLMNKHSDIVAEHLGTQTISTTSGNGSTASHCGDRTFSAADRR